MRVWREVQELFLIISVALPFPFFPTQVEITLNQTPLSLRNIQQDFLTHLIFSLFFSLHDTTPAP